MKTNLIAVFVLCLITLSCKNESGQTAVNDTGLIEITKAQFESEKMEIGGPVLYPYSDIIYFTGTVIPSINGQAQISLPLPGKINKIHYKPGQIVDKGSVIFEVSGNEFVDLQKDFAESSAILERLKSDYYRAKELYEENIATQKDFTLAQSNFYAENAKYNALKIKLESMGLDVLKIEKGQFYTTYDVKSPIMGFVAVIDVAIGQYVDPQHKIAEIIDSKSLQLKLSVFERNIGSIKIGQNVSFYLNGNKSRKYKATINVVGKIIMPDSKSVECLAVIEKPKDVNIVSNQFVEGEIYAAVDSVLAVPESAIIISENDSYLLIFEKEAKGIYYFKKVKTNIGRKANGYAEITDEFPYIRVLVNGVYNIQIEK